MKEAIVFFSLIGIFVIAIGIEHLYTYWRSRRIRNGNPNDVFLP